MLVWRRCAAGGGAGTRSARPYRLAGTGVRPVGQFDGRRRGHGDSLDVERLCACSRSRSSSARRTSAGLPEDSKAQCEQVALRRARAHTPTKVGAGPRSAWRRSTWRCAATWRSEAAPPRTGRAEPVRTGSARAPVVSGARRSAAQLGRDQLRDLDGVQRGALAQVVVGDEQRQPVLTVSSARIRPTKDGSWPAACSGVGTSESSTPGASASSSRARCRGDRPGEAGVDLERVAGEDRHADAGAGDLQLRDLQDLAALVAELLLLVGLVEPSSTIEPASGSTLKAIGPA